MDDKKLYKCTKRSELAVLLGVDLNKLTYFAYGRGNRYEEFLIPRKSGGFRTISAPKNGLVTVQRRLTEYLAEVYNPPACVNGFIEGRSIVRNARPHVRKRTILNIDLKDFFPTISDRRIIKLLKAIPLGLSDEVVSTITRLVCYKGVLPQGAPTSPVLSNMICLRLDNQLTALCRNHRLTYTRYADDITISTTNERFPPAVASVDEEGVVTVGNELAAIIKNNWFQINNKKTRISGNFQSKFVTGVKVNTRLNVSRTYVRELRAMIDSLKKKGLERAQRDYVEKYNGKNHPFELVVRGKLAHLRNVKGYYDPVYRNLYNRFASIEGIRGIELPNAPEQELLDKILVIHGKGNGSGFILDHEWLITCDHVVDDATEVEYFTYDDYSATMRHPANVHSELRSPKEKFDLIALEPSLKHLYSDFYSFDSGPVDSVHESGEYRVVGFPDYHVGNRPRILDVKVSEIRVINGVQIAYVDRPLISGQSGSPVLNDFNQVVGIVQTGSPNMRAGEHDYRHTFLPISEMRKCLNEFRSALDVNHS